MLRSSPGRGVALGYVERLPLVGLEKQMALYLVVGITGALAVVWLAGYLLSALLDAGRPREVDGQLHPFESERLQPVQHLNQEWRDVRRRSVDEDDPDAGTRAA